MFNFLLPELISSWSKTQLYWVGNYIGLIHYYTYHHSSQASLIISIEWCTQMASLILLTRTELYPCKLYAVDIIGIGRELVCPTKYLPLI